MIKTIFVLILFFTSCVSIQKNLLTEKQYLLNKDISLSFSLRRYEMKNNQINNEYSLNDDTINYNNENCNYDNWSKIKWPTEHPVYALSNMQGAQQACQIQIFLSTIPKIKKVRFVLEKSEGVYLQIKSVRNLQISDFSPILALVSLGIIPFKSSSFQTWEVTLFKNGTLIKKYKYMDEFEIWHSLFVLPMIPFVDGYKKSEINLNKKFVNNLIYDLSKDGYLE